MARRTLRVKSISNRTVVGGKPTRKRTDRLESVLALSVAGQQSAIAKGLPFDAILRLQELLGVPLDRLAKLVAIPSRTLARRRTEGVLDALESDRVLRIARLFVRTRALFDGDDEDAREWLTTAQRALGSSTPLAFASTEVGAREVEALIGRLAHGVFS